MSRWIALLVVMLLPIGGFMQGGWEEAAERSLRMELERQEYKGHRIELRARGADELRAREGEPINESELLIDDEPIRYGQLPDGRYALHEYAYDWSDNLMDLARRFIDYRSRSDEIRRERDPR
jgi:hypothetical protein